MDAHALARMIDHTILKPEATPAEIDRVIDEAIEHRFASVCVATRYIATVAKRLQGTDIKACATIGFPHGTGSIGAKVEEVKYAVKNGAQEIDFVFFLPNLLAGSYQGLSDECTQIARHARMGIDREVVVKGIIESSAIAALSPNTFDSIVETACRACRDGGVNFIKTSTGFHPAGGATVEHVRLMKKYAGSGLQVKASGGIRDTKTALAMIDAGATRLGLSASVAIVKGIAAAESGY